MSLEFRTATRAKLTHVNPRDEHHGDLHIPALDLRFTVEAPNYILDLFHLDLRSWLYVPSNQGQLDGVEQVAQATELRFPNMTSPIKWDDSLHSYSLTVNLASNEMPLIQIAECRVHKQVIEAKRGGTCCVSFTSSTAEKLTAEMIGALALHVRQEVEISMVKPAVSKDSVQKQD